MSHAPPQPGEMLLERDELRPGDLLFGRETQDWTCTADFPGHEVIDGEYALSATTKTRYKISHYTGGGRWRVVRPKATAPQPPTGRWNGRCHCGSNIYVGFIAVEHESPECQTR